MLFYFAPSIDVKVEIIAANFTSKLNAINLYNQMLFTKKKNYLTNLRAYLHVYNACDHITHTFIYIYMYTYTRKHEARRRYVYNLETCIEKRIEGGDPIHPTDSTR